MSKKDFIALADAIIAHNTSVPRYPGSGWTTQVFNSEQIKALADFCQSQSGQFQRSRWLGYIAGENGTNGGKVGKP